MLPVVLVNHWVNLVLQEVALYWSYGSDSFHDLWRKLLGAQVEVSDISFQKTSYGILSKLGFQ